MSFRIVFGGSRLGTMTTELLTRCRDFRNLWKKHGPSPWIPTAVELSSIAASGLLPPHEPSLFSPQIQGYRRLGFASICGSPESVGKLAFRRSMREAV